MDSIAAEQFWYLLVQSAFTAAVLLLWNMAPVSLRATQNMTELLPEPHWKAI